MIEEIVGHAREEAPNECCGIVAGGDGRATRVYRATNSEASPLRYNLDSKDLFRISMDIDERGEAIAAIYHSHTHSPAEPSQTDINLATYPEALYVIASIADPERPDVRAFRIREGAVEPVEIVVE